MYNYQCSEKGRCPDTDTDDTKTHADYYFHFQICLPNRRDVSEVIGDESPNPLAYTLLNNNKTIRFATTFVLN